MSLCELWGRQQFAFVILFFVFLPGFSSQSLAAARSVTDLFFFVSREGKSCVSPLGAYTVSVVNTPNSVHTQFATYLCSYRFIAGKLVCLRKPPMMRLRRVP